MQTTRTRQESAAFQKHRQTLGLDKMAWLAKTGLDEDTLLHKSVEILNQVFLGDFLFVGSVDPDTYLVKQHYVRNHSVNLMQRLYENEYLEDDFNKYTQLAHASSSVGILSRTLDGELERSVRFREIYKKSFGMQHEMRAVLKVGRRMAGFITLLRPADGPEFALSEYRFLSSFIALIEDGLRSAMLAQLRAGTGEATGTGLVILNEDMSVGSANTVGERWVRELGQRFDFLAGSLSTVVQLNSELDAPNNAPFYPRIRLRSKGGQWLTIEGYRLHSAAGDQRLSLVIEGTRGEHLQSMMYEVYGFTDRERDLLQCVLRGSSTRQIAQELNISEYTVQDYFKGIFDKTGVRSRRDLIAKLLFDRA